MRNHGQQGFIYRLPIGGDLQLGIEKICSIEHNNAPIIWAAEGERLDEFIALYGDRYSFVEDIPSFDYVYPTEALSNLVGKKYQSKRNHISAFTRKHDWSYKCLDGSNISLIRECMEEWYADTPYCESLCKEKQGIEYILDKYDRMDIKGGCVIVGGKCVAFTFGVAINADIFDICIEKALPDYPEAYSVINREFAKCLNCEFINRENDMGITGLRKAKQSYHPCFMVKKYFCIGRG